MDKQTFVETMKIACDYYGREFTPELTKIYYEELGGMQVRELEECIRHHIRTMKSFPQIAHLRPAGNNTSQDLRKPQHHEHPEWRRHWESAEKIMRAKLNGRGVRLAETFLFPLNDLVDAALESAQRVEAFYDDDDANKRIVESAAYGNLNVLLANQFRSVA